MIDKKVVISISVLLALIVGTCFLIKVIFSGKGSSNDNLYKQIIAAQDSANAKERDKIVLYERIIEEKERTNEALGQRDSVLNSHYNETEKLYKDINAKIQNIPNRINRIANNPDSIARAFANF